MAFEQFKTWIPASGRGGVNISKGTLSVSSVYASAVDGKRLELGYDGHKRFILRPAEHGGIKLTKSRSAFVSYSRPLIRFIRAQLGLKDGERIHMQAKIVDGVLMFGVFDNDIRDK